jgi:hypothetical protein
MKAATVAGAGDDRIGLFYPCLLQTGQSGGDTHADDTAHSPQELRVEQGFIVGFDAFQPGANVFDGGRPRGPERILWRDARGRPDIYAHLFAD